MEDIFAYADDILILCDNLETLKKCIETIEDWSELNNLKINRSKSAVIEFIHRRCKKFQLTVNETFMEYPIVSQYKYLGTWLNQKLTLDTQVEYVMKSAEAIRRKLSPVIYHTSLDFRKNLWQVFIQPLFEFTLPLYYFEEASTRKQKLQVCLRNSFKSFTTLKRTVKSELIDELMGYNVEERSKEIHVVSTLKWVCRRNGNIYEKESSQTKKEKTNLCKNQPKVMIKYINMQTASCSRCKLNNSIIRCIKEHI